MQKELHYKGIWFLPERPGDQLPGDLHYSATKGIDLDLLGVFPNEREKSHDPEIILGISSDGKRITLYKGARSGRSFNSNSFETSKYDAIFMFIGNHFMSTDEMVFSRISCDWADFDTWLGIYGFRKVEYKKDTKESFIEYQQPTNLLFDVSDIINCEFQFSTYHPSVKRLSKLTIQQKCEVSLSAKTGDQKFEVLFDWFESFHRLMTLAYFEELPINKLTLGKMKTSTDNEPYISSVEVFFQTNASESRYKNRSNDYSFLFTYGDVSGNLEQILQQWYKAESTLSPTIAGLTEAFMNRNQPTEFRFLNLAHAIETFHRRTRRTEITLQKRLEELTQEVPDPIRTLLFKPTVPEFITTLKITRNYYTHYDESLEGKALKGAELFIFSERLKIFLICLVLKEIGFTNDELIRTILKKGVKLFNHIIKYDEAKVHFSDW